MIEPDKPKNEQHTVDIPVESDFSPTNSAKDDLQGLLSRIDADEVRDLRERNEGEMQ